MFSLIFWNLLKTCSNVHIDLLDQMVLLIFMLTHFTSSSNSCVAPLNPYESQHVLQFLNMRTTILDNSFSRDRWKTFTSSGASSSSSFSTSEIGGFEGVATSSAMTKFSPISTKTKRVPETMWYLRSKGVEVFLL